MPNRFALTALVSIVVALGLNAPSSAQSYPTKPIRVVVPYAAGGGVDIVARGVAEGITKQFGHAVLVENRTGAGSNVGSTVVAKADPDGYTLLMGSNANAVNGSLYSSMPYDAERDLVQIILVGRVPMVMLASPALPFRTVREVIDHAKSKPGSLNFGSGGAGTSEHLTYERFKRRAWIEAVHVPYRGGAAVYPDLMNGRVDFLFNNQLQAMPFIRSGQVRALAIANPKRSPQLPEVPTLAEQGIADFNAAAWWGIMGPAGIPEEIVNKINQLVGAVMESPEFGKRLDSLGAERLGGTPQQFRDFFKSEMATWSGVIKAEKIKVE